MIVVLPDFCVQCVCYIVLHGFAIMMVILLYYYMLSITLNLIELLKYILSIQNVYPAHFSSCIWM